MKDNAETKLIAQVMLEMGAANAAAREEIRGFKELDILRKDRIAMLEREVEERKDDTQKYKRLYENEVDIRISHEVDIKRMIHKHTEENKSLNKEVNVYKALVRIINKISRSRVNWTREQVYVSNYLLEQDEEIRNEINK